MLPALMQYVNKSKNFLVNIFIVSDLELNQYDAEILAKRLRVNDEGLQVYLLSNQTLIKINGDAYGEIFCKVL